MPVRAIVTDGPRVVCKEAISLIQNLLCKVLLADRGYDSDEIIEYAKKFGHTTGHSSKKKSKNPAHLQRSFLQKTPSRRKYIPSAKSLLARNRNPLCQKTFVFCRLRSSRLCHGLALNSCRYILKTTIVGGCFVVGDPFGKSIKNKAG